MKYFTVELVKDYMEECDWFNDFDECKSFVDQVKMYLDAVHNDRRFVSLYNELEKVKDEETIMQFIEMTKRANQFSTILIKETNKFNKEKRKIANIGQSSLIVQFLLKWVQQELIRKSVSRFLRLRLYLDLYSNHFNRFKKSIIYRKSSFREWEDIDDNTTLYDVLPLFDGSSKRSTLFYTAVQFSVGWSFYCKMFRAKEFLNLYGLTVQDMKENDVYYIIKALGVSFSDDQSDFYYSKLIPQKIRESKKAMQNLKTISVSLSEQYEKETGLNTEMLMEQNLFSKRETPRFINRLKEMMEDARKNSKVTVLGFDENKNPVLRTFSIEDLPDKIRKQIKEEIPKWVN